MYCITIKSKSKIKKYFKNIPWGLTTSTKKRMTFDKLEEVEHTMDLLRPYYKMSKIQIEQVCECCENSFGGSGFHLNYVNGTVCESCYFASKNK